MFRTCEKVKFQCKLIITFKGIEKMLMKLDVFTHRTFTTKQPFEKPALLMNMVAFTHDDSNVFAYVMSFIIKDIHNSGAINNWPQICKWRWVTEMIIS